MIEKVQKLFRVDNPGRHLLLDNGPPVWNEGNPDWASHLAGKRGLCITPIGMDNTCYFGALDIDAKGDAPPLPHAVIQVFLLEHNLPLNLYLSKSGKGAHAYLFSPRPVKAEDMRSTLLFYSVMIAHLIDKSNTIEIFPKQNILEEGEDGSCIRPPYFGSRSVPVFKGDPIVKNIVAVPQCLRELPEEGERNNFIYHLTNFLLLIEAENVRKLMRIINDNMEFPLPSVEVERTVASAQRQKTRSNTGFGLGCTFCPDNRKKKCQFSSQLKTKEVTDNMSIEIVHYISEEPKIRLTFEDKSLIFTPDDLFNNHKVRIDFITKHRLPAVPLMTKGEWGKMLHSLLESAEHVDIITHRDKGHFIIQQLKKWSKDFKPGINYLYSGTPVFLSSDEVMLFSHDVYNRFMTTGIQGITREDINMTLESVGSVFNIDGNPAIKIPAVLFGNDSPGLEIPIISDIPEEEIQIETGKDGVAIFKDKNGAQIELTNSYIKEHPAIQQRMLEATKTKVNLQF